MRDAATTARSSRSRYSLPGGLGDRGAVLPVGEPHHGDQLVRHGHQGVGGRGWLPGSPWRPCSAHRWLGARPAGRRARAARPPGSARGGAQPAWRCGARSRSGATGRSPRAGRPSPSPRPPARRAAWPATTGTVGALTAGRALTTLVPRSARRGAVASTVLSARRSATPTAAAAVPTVGVVVATRRLPEPGARMTETSGARLGVPLTSMRPSSSPAERSGLRSAQRQNLDPFEPDLDVRRATPHRRLLAAGTRAPSTTPLGWRAPAARHVHDPSAAPAGQLDIDPA